MRCHRLIGRLIYLKWIDTKIVTPPKKKKRHRIHNNDMKGIAIEKMLELLSRVNIIERFLMIKPV